MAINLIDKIKNGENIYGTCIVSTSPIWSKVVNNIQLDFVFLDTEHIPLDRTELTFMCQTYDALGISPIVRISGPDPYQACMAKDAGAIGVVFPYVESTEQIRQLVGATKYRPLKGERLQNVLQGKEKLEPELAEYLKNYNTGSMCIANIESIAEDPERQIKWMKAGANIILHSSDMFLFSQKLKEDMGKIKAAAGDDLKESTDSGLAI